MLGYRILQDLGAYADTLCLRFDLKTAWPVYLQQKSQSTTETRDCAIEEARAQPPSLSDPIHGMAL